MAEPYNYAELEYIRRNSSNGVLRGNPARWLATVDRLKAALQRIADPDDECHLDYGGPWQDVAAAALKEV